MMQDYLSCGTYQGSCGKMIEVVQGKFRLDKKQSVSVSSKPSMRTRLFPVRLVDSL